MQQDWDTLERLFSEAMELPAAERQRFVEERSGDNAWMRRELKTLLEVPSAKADAAFDSGTGIVRELLAALDTEYAVGREIGGYRIESLISSGGMGIVYRATDTSTGEAVALKLLPPEDVRNPNRIRRLGREAAALKMLDHPGIVKIKAYGADAGGHFLAMELVAGETLRAVLAQRRLGLGQALDWAAQMAGAVEAAHERGVVHRDLKPSNVMIEDGRVKLLDFGLARAPEATGPAHTRTTVEGTVAGTYSYFSPEQARGERADERSDIFSFGAILYEMLTGWTAFERVSAVATAAAVLQGAPEPLPAGVPRAVKALVERCLEKEPARRFGSMAMVRAELERLCGLEKRGRLKPPVSRTRWAAAAAALVLGAGAAAGWFWSRPTPPRAPDTIAVLPFTNASGDTGSQYIVDGLTEELTTELERAKGLRVAPAASVSPFKKAPRDLADIGRRLRVSYLVEASVSRAGEYLKVVASLKRAAGGAPLWTNTYQRRSGDLSAIEADLAAGVRSSLGLAAPGPKRAPVSEQAHDVYLKARFEAQGISIAANSQAQADFRRAIELDPGYAPAYSGLATAIWNRNLLAGQSANRDELRQAEQLWRKALELDPRLASAHSGLAYYVMQYDWDWDHAERELQAALAVGPDMTAEGAYAFLCLIRGRRPEADEHLRKMRDLDPEEWAAAGNAASIFRLEHRYVDARAEMLKLISRSPNVYGAQVVLSLTYAADGQPEEGIRLLRPLLAKDPRYAVPLAWSEALAGNRVAALRLLGGAEKTYQKSLVPLNWYAMAYAALDDEANTVKWLERSMDAREFVALYIHVEPLYAKYQDTPKFHTLKRRMNLDW